MSCTSVNPEASTLVLNCQARTRTTTNTLSSYVYMCMYHDAMTGSLKPVLRHIAVQTPPTCDKKRLCHCVLCRYNMVITWLCHGYNASSSSFTDGKGLGWVIMAVVWLHGVSSRFSTTVCIMDPLRS